MTSPLFEIDTKATCLLCFSPNCPPIEEKTREDGDELNFDKLNATKRGFRVLLRFLKVDFTKLSHFTTASAFHKLFVKSSQVNLSVSLCNDCSSVTRDFFELFQVFENIRIQLDLCVKQLHEFIERGRKDEERLRKYRERMKAGNTGGMGLVQSSIAEELRSEVQKKCSLKLKRSLPRIMVTNWQNSCGKIRPTEESGRGSQQESHISGSTSKEPAEEKDYCIPTPTATPVANNKNGVKRNPFLSRIAKFKAKAKAKNKVLQSSRSQSVQRVHPPKSKRDLSKHYSTSRVLQQVLADRIPSSVADAEHCSKGKPQLASEIKRKRRLKANTAVAEQRGGENWFKKFAKYEKSETLKSEISLKCLLCEKKFKKRDNFQVHLMTQHFFNFFSNRIPPGVSQLEVRKAIFYFVSKAKVSTKSAEVGKGKRRQCTFCEKEWTALAEWGWRSKLKIHILSVHFEEVIEKMKPESEQVSKVILPSSFLILDPKSRLTGKAEKTGGKWKCLECGKELASVDSFHKHYRRFHADINGLYQPRKCFECDKIFKHRDSLEHHRMINHTMKYFGGRIPSSISESRLESSLTHFVDKVQDAKWASLQNGGTTEKWPCPLCKKGMCCTKRYHFLQSHLSDVIEHAEKEIETTSGDNEGNLGETFGNKHRSRLQKGGTTLINCEHCGRTFNSNFHLHRHLISDHSYNFFKHRLPEEVSQEGLEKGLASMMKKLDLAHGLDLSFECSVCGKGCRNRWTMRMHLLLAHFKQVVEKSVTITSTSALLKSESEPVVAFEVVPGLKTEHHQNERLKVENMDEEITITEPFLAKVEPDRVELETEPQTKSKKRRKLKTNVCTICGKVLTSSEGIRQHYRRVHLRIATNVKREIPGKCGLCGKTFPQKQYVLRHKLQVHPIEFLKDKLPSGVTKQQLNEAVEGILQQDMTTHLSTENEGESKNMFECPVCNTKRSEKSNLKIHLLHCHLERVVEKIGDPRLPRPKRRPFPSETTPGTWKCDHCEKYIDSAGHGGKRRKHLMLDHALILYRKHFPPELSEKEFEEALRRVQQASMKALPKNRSDPRHFVECTLCSKKMRKHPRDSRFHMLTCHLDQVVKKAEMIHGGKPLSPESILPD